MAQTQQTPRLGDLVHTEIASTDAAATRRFLEKLFGWSFEKTEMPGEYWMYQTPGGDRGAVRDANAKEPPACTNYVLVADLDEAEKGVREAGGTIVLPRVDVPGMGSFFWFQAPGGPVLACWQPAKE